MDIGTRQYCVKSSHNSQLKPNYIYVRCWALGWMRFSAAQDSILYPVVILCKYRSDRNVFRGSKLYCSWRANPCESEWVWLGSTGILMAILRFGSGSAPAFVRFVSVWSAIYLPRSVVVASFWENVLSRHDLNWLCQQRFAFKKY